MKFIFFVVVYLFLGASSNDYFFSLPYNNKKRRIYFTFYYSNEMPLFDDNKKLPPKPTTVSTPATTEGGQTGPTHDDGNQPQQQQPINQCSNGSGGGGGGVAPTEIIKITIDYEEGDLMGIVLDDEIFVKQIQKDTRADGKLKIGDRIISMNGRLIKDTDMFYHLIQKMHPQILIVVERKLLKTVLTEERIKQTNFEPNVETSDYFIAHLSKLHGMQLGLSVKTGENSRVIVTKVESESLSELCFEVGDIIIDGNGERVTNKDSTKALLKKALIIEGYASTIVERIKPEAAVSVREILKFDEKNRDPKVAQDVIEIGRAQIAVIKQRQLLLQKENVPKLKSILIKPDRIETQRTKRTKKRRKNCYPGGGGGSPIDGSTKYKNVKFNKQAYEIPIQSDTRDPTKLVPIPKDRKDRSKANFALLQTKMPKSNFFSNL